MKELLFIGHTYHQKTKSSVFLLDLLREEYQVTEHYLDPEASVEYKSLQHVKTHAFDVVVIWQVMPRLSELRKVFSWKHAVFFPMYDHYIAHNGFYADIWKEYAECLVISFSRALYKDLLKLGYEARYIQYFPKPNDIANWGDEKALFFWQRLSIVNLATVAKAAQNLGIQRIHLHKAMDPGHCALSPSIYTRSNPTFFKDITFSESTWFEDKEEMIQTLEGAALYMAPRHLEGIGMSFLEAMARGRCVIAPDNPTMNEYIENGVSGFLYPWSESSDSHCKVALSPASMSIREMQQNAYRSIVEGYERWSREKYQILEWLEQEVQTDKEKIARNAILFGWEDWPLDQQPWPNPAEWGEHLIEKKAQEPNDAPKTIDVSVVTVVYNVIKDGRHDMFLECLESVQAQTGVNVEHIIVDGASTDGTLDLLKRFVNTRHDLRILSLKDNGIYDAMNRGIALAQGTYVVFLNSDDFYHLPDGLRLSVESLNKHKCAYSFAPVKVLDNSLFHNPHVSPSRNIRDVFVHSVFSHQSVLVRRDVMLQMHGFDLSYRSAADYDFILRMILTGLQGCYVNHHFVSYRMIGVSSTNLFLSGHETALVYKRLYNRYVGAHLTENEAYRLHRYNEFPKNDPTLASRLNKFIDTAFIDLPKEKQHTQSYWPEVKYVLQQLSRFNFKQLYYFCLIHFNSRFDRRWYLATNRDVRKSKMAPAAHYLEYGWREGRDPSLLFSTSRYLSNNPDVQEMGICPLLHWKLKGKREKRSFE